MKQSIPILEFEGHNYIVLHKYSTHQYTRKSVYHILTNNQKYCGAIINDIAGYSEVEPKWLHDERYEKNPCFENYLKPYYEVEFVEGDKYKGCDVECVDTDSYYVLTITYPYDD